MCRGDRRGLIDPAVWLIRLGPIQKSELTLFSYGFVSKHIFSFGFLMKRDRELAELNVI